MTTAEPTTAGTAPAHDARRATLILLGIWLAAAVFLIVWRWPAVRTLGLGDTDDNMRLMQVRALLDGQGWFDLRQYRLDPPRGADIHWSRLVDLPIAGMIVVLKPWVGTFWAERWAAGIAPLLPLGVAMLAIGHATRRLIASNLYVFAAMLLLAAQSALGMFQPMRIDHHGWQLASIALLVLGLSDHRPLRGGLTAGAASALSLVIGLEMLPYLALAAAAAVLAWVHDGRNADRMTGHGLALAAGTAIGFAGFASYANRAPVCDALSPVWLSVMLTAGAAMVALARLRLTGWQARLIAAGVAGAVLAAAFVLVWPGCVGRPEHVSPELDRLWLSNVREAKPIYRQDWKLAVAIAALPLIGLTGSLWALWRVRGDRALATRWAMIALLPLAATVLLLWQARAAPAAQLLALPGAGALLAALVLRARSSTAMLVRVFGTAAAFVLASGLFVQFALETVPDEKPSAYRKQINSASARCPAVSVLSVLNRLPSATMFTLVDLSPRLIVVTHHSAIAGPYHRNGAAILDVHHFFDGDVDNARAIAERHRADYVLLCPDMPETTIYRARSPKGFYVQLADGRVPDWLTPVPLPKGSPLRLWRITASRPAR